MQNRWFYLSLYPKPLDRPPPHKYLKEILYEIFGFRFLPYKTYEFVKEHVPPGGESASNYKTSEFVLREAHRRTNSIVL